MITGVVFIHDDQDATAVATHTIAKSATIEMTAIVGPPPQPFFFAGRYALSI
jgi:hypothetical protein